MWKCAKKSLRETFKKGVLSTRASQSKELEPIHQNNPLRLSPILIEHYSQFYNACKNSCENFIKRKKDRERLKEKAWFSGAFDTDFFCFLKWSGVFALGYTYMQYKVKIFSYLNHKKLQFYTINGHHKSLEYLIDVFGIRPYNYAIPEVEAAKSKNGSSNLQQFTEFASKNYKSDEVNFSALEKAYQAILGTLNNKLGTQCMQSGEHKEAVEYFVQAAQDNHAPGIFNLGICHERGLGTSQNFKKAAELYQRAADLGHATAMYNLGVFYAQGKGGIKTDLNHARELFEAAATLGQKDAVKALNLEKHVAGEPPKSGLVSDSNEKTGNTANQFIQYELLSQSSLNSFLKNYSVCDELKSSCDSVEYSEEKEINPSLGSDSGVLDMSPESQQFVLLV